MLFLSIRPRFVDAILAGTKRVELRRRRPAVSGGRALIYATFPRMELVASFCVAGVVRAPLGLLWQTYGEVASVTRHEFDAYFDGLEFGIAIEIHDVMQFDNPVPIAELRASWSGFHPPQSFCYLDSKQVDMLGIRELRETRVA
jgi:predicted transcriptional regulator